MENNNIKKIAKFFVLLVTITLLTGCTKQLKNSDGKVVQNPETGQALTKNILCKPTNEENIILYAENNIDISKLPDCDEFSVFKGDYDGIWTTLFVKPLSWVILKVGSFVKNYGIAVIITTLLIRLIAMPLTKKTAMQSENMKKAKPEMDRIEYKYRGRQDQESMMMKSQEMMAVYKKYGINPISGCLFGFLQIPLFFAFYEAIYRLPAIFEDTFLGFNLGMSPMKGIKEGNYLYAIFIILVVLATYFSFKLNSGASMSKEQEKQMNFMRKFMIIFISIASLSIPIGTALYWIFNSGFTIFQNLLVKRKVKA